MELYQEQEEKTERTAGYSALTFVLLIFIVQAGFGMVVNIVRNIDIYAKLKVVSRANKLSEKRNKTLKHELNSFNSAKSLESIARNNLKMAGDNEILLIINSDTDVHENRKEKPVKEKGIFYRR